MKTKKSSSKEFNLRLATYSATAMAALLAVPDAKATIETITINDISSGGIAGTIPTLSLPRTGRGGNSLSFIAGPLNGGLGGSQDLDGQVSGALKGQFAAQIIHSSTSGGGLFTVTRSINHLAKGANIEGLSFAKNGYRPFTFKSSTNARGTVTGYVGFKTNKNAQTYYGWLKVKVEAEGGSPGEITLIDNGNGIFGAYGLKSDDITVGQVVATPEPSVAALGGLALLACGAAGVREMRRRRKDASGD